MRVYYEADAQLQTGGPISAGGTKLPPSADGPSGVTGPVRVKVNGAWREYSPEETYTLVSKAGAADEALRTAAETRKELEAKKPHLEKIERWERLLDTVKANTPESAEAARTLIRDFGLGDDTADEALAMVEGANQGSGQSQGALSTAQAALLNKTARFFAECEKKGLDPVASLERLTKSQESFSLQQAHDYVTTWAQKHPQASRFVRGDRGQIILGDIWSRFQRRVASREPVTDATIQKAWEETLAILDAGEVAMPREPSDGIRPTAFGASPDAFGSLGSRLQPPKMPEVKDYPGDLAGYTQARIAYEKRVNSDARN